jgi:hypothetical protein
MLGVVSTALLATVITVGPQSPAQGAQSFVADYTVSLYGLPVARSRFNSTFDDGKFTVHGSLSSAGIARIFDSTQGTTTVSGTITPAAARPSLYLMNYTSGKKRKKTEIRFSRGNVTRTENVPPLRTKPNWVDVERGHLAAVADPISATLVPAGSPAEVCQRTIRLYDGEMRADLKLSPGGTEAISIGEFDGEATVCNARFVPVSGYRAGHRSIEYLRNKSKISIAFAELGTTGVYAPLKASIGTEIGTLHIEARSFRSVSK